MIWRFITTDWMAKRLRKAVNLSLSFESFVLRANHAIYNRISNSSRGIRNDLTLMPRDINNMLRGADPTPLQEDQLRRVQLRIGEDGFITRIVTDDESFFIRVPDCPFEYPPLRRRGSRSNTATRSPSSTRRPSNPSIWTLLPTRRQNCPRVRCQFGALPIFI